MNQRMRKIVGYGITIVVLVLGFAFAAGTQAQGACTITNPTFIPSGQGGTSIMNAPWYTDANPPTLGFSVDVSDCAGDGIKVEVLSSGVSQGSFSTVVPASSSGDGTLSASIVAGEENCAGTNNPNCILSIRASVNGQAVLTSSGSFQSNTSGIVGYLCDAVCDQFFGSVSFSPPNWGQAPGSTSSTTAGFSRLQNPIQYDNIPDVIRSLITIVFVIGIPLVALAIIYAGFLLVTAGGDQNKLTKGKQALLAGVIGGAILLGAWVIAEAIQGTVDQIRGV